MTRPDRRRRLFRALTVALVLLLGTELALQGARLWARSTLGRSGITQPGAPVILCLGDSHTYGAGVKADEAYPEKLQALFRKNGYSVNVINLGAPGMNTSEIRRRLPEWLDAYKPVAVIVLASVNNGWNRRDAAFSDRADGLPVHLATTVFDFLTDKIMLVRAATIIFHRLDWTRPPEESSRDREGRIIIHHREEAWKVESAQANFERARRDLVAIVSDCRAAQAEPILMTYVTEPDFTFETPNLLLRLVARETKTILADNDEAFKPVLFRNSNLDRTARDKYFMPDMHPTEAGYQIIAENVFRVFEKSSLADFLQKEKAGP